MPLDPLFTAVEQTLADDLNVDSLAEAGLLSRSQLYRAFYSTAGHSVKEYVRKRRLSAALALIKHSDLPLAQIAQDCGFGSVQALCKAVKSATGLTPSRYKSGGEEYYFPPADGRSQFTVSVSSENLPPTQCLHYYDSCLQGIEDRALAWLFAKHPGYCGRIFGRNGQQKGTKLCYELYIESRRADHPAMTGTFAKTSCENSEAAANAAWDYLYNDWLKTSMFSLDQTPYFEEYIHSNGAVKRLQLYLPVVKRPGFHKIRLMHSEDMHFLAACRYGADAEKSASKAVMDFLAVQHPHLARTARRFYVSTAQEDNLALHLVNKESCTCGIALPSAMTLPEGCNVQMLTKPAGTYAVLEGDCCGDAGAYEAVLSAWIGSTGLAAEGAPFAVCESGGSFQREDVRVRMYWKIQK